MRVALIGIRRLKMSSTSNAAGVLIQYRDKFLLCKRGYFGTALDGFWAPPAGAIDEGERPQVAAIRELYEEAGILLDKEQLSLISKEKRIDKRGLFYLYYHDSPVLRHLSLNFEHDGYAYFGRDELPAPLCPNIKNTIFYLTSPYEI